ncbi:MAG: type II toxin-antitoxin system ParD family antitoxin [Magnetococcales bacterium]|nr:type II toxin-antitoxin system ParD family antitoxin [Magnetococcales bacterium]
MATMNVSLPDPMRKWVESQVESGSYANASDYVRDLIRQDQRQREMLKLALAEAEESGISGRKVSDIIQVAKARMHGG